MSNSGLSGSGKTYGAPPSASAPQRRVARERISARWSAADADAVRMTNDENQTAKEIRNPKTESVLEGSRTLLERFWGVRRNQQNAGRGRRAKLLIASETSSWYELPYRGPFIFHAANFTALAPSVTNNFHPFL